jgi:hypothetical protein
MPRSFRVITNTDPETGYVYAFGVSDITDAEWEAENKLKTKRQSISEKYKYVNDEEVRPRLVTFKVNQLYGMEEQKEMAHAVCAYMNKIAQAQSEAVKQHSLLEVLTSKAAEYKEE